MNFEFATATRIIFGPGTIQKLSSLVSGFGSRPFIVTGKSQRYNNLLIEQLQGSPKDPVIFSISKEPTTHLITEGTRLARESECNWVIGIGGGSIIDSGKAIAALLTNSGDLLDYLEVIGKGEPLLQNPVPYVAIPTTAGTGAEVTRNAVLGSPEHQVKVSMRSPLMLPQLAIVDPELTYSIPPEVTANTGLDALTQLMEAYVSNQSNPLTDGICLEGIKRVSSSLEGAYLNGEDTEARENMALASLFGGLALTNAKLGAVHGFAGPLGGMYSASHGLICARLLPFVMKANIEALTKRNHKNPSLIRYKEVARILTGYPGAQAEDGAEWIQKLCQTLQIPSLKKIGITERDFETIVEKSKNSSSMKGNPIPLTEEELTHILQQASE